MISTARLILKRELGLGDRLGGGLTRPAQRHIGIGRAGSLPLHPQVRGGR